MAKARKDHQITVREFIEASDGNLGIELMAGEKHLDQKIVEAMVNRPGLALAGFFKYFANKRIQVLGLAETSYLKNLSQEERQARLKRFFKARIPCVVFSRNRRPSKEIRALAEAHKVPLMRSKLVTGDFINRATLVMENLVAPRPRRHGTMVEIKGIGVLIEGKSGIGKSEIALALLEAGHSLVSDDSVLLLRDSTGRLIGSAPELTRYHMEIRGIGFIHVSSLFGITSIRKRKALDLVVELVASDAKTKIDRTGLNRQSSSILGVSIPKVTVPVAPGRDMANVIEVAAMNQKLKNPAPKRKPADVSELSASYTIENKFGLHARPCSALVMLAGEFECEIDIEHEDVRVSAKSILGLLTLAAGPEAKVTLYAEGPDAQTALDALGKLIKDKFGED